jgi:multidrug resistance protein, MATE family
MTPHAAAAISGANKSELATIAQHAGTVMVGQLAVMAFSITDTIVAGRYAPEALAVLSIGASIYVSVYVSLMGVMQALLPVYAELHGARHYPELGRSVRQSLYLAMALVLLGMAVMLFPQPLLRAAQVPEALRPAVENYLGILAWALLPSLGFRMYSSLNQALGKPKLVTALQVASLIIKVPLTIWLAFGGLGVPALGLAGCAWATFIVNWLMLLCALLMLRTQTLYQPLKLMHQMEPPNWPLLARFARTGLPGGMAYLVEITSFTLMALFIARLGIVPAASHQIASNMAGVMYMLPLALSIACSARVSYWIGAGSPVRARAVARLGVGMTVALASVVALLTYVLAHPIAALYSTDAAVVALASSLLVWVAAYHWFDALQTICAFVLRCYSVTLLPLLIYGVMLWGVGLGGGYALAYTDGMWGAAMQSAQAFWLAGAAALAVVSALFLALLVHYALATPRVPARHPKSE